MSADDEYDPRAHAKAAAYLESLAADLGERAVLRKVEGSLGQEAWTLTPRNPRAIPARIEVDPYDTATLWVEYLDQVDTCGIEYLRLVVGALVLGNVRTLEGAGRRRVEVTVAEGDTRSETAHIGWRGLIPAPWWMKGARRSDFEPYT